MTATITAQDAADLYDCDDGATAGPWTRAGTQHIRQSRWHDMYYLVVRDEAGQHWGLVYGDGLTEYQDNEWPWEYSDDPLPLTRLYPHEVIKVEFRCQPATVD